MLHEDWLLIPVKLTLQLKREKKLTKVDQMWDGVEPGLAEDQPAHNFVEVDTVVQGELVCQPHVPEKRHEVTKHEY